MIKPVNTPQLIIISGPSGVGKGTIISELVRRNRTLSVAISATTRAPRLREVNGRDYYFMTKLEFKSIADDGNFLEWCEVHGNYYGTLKSELHRIQHQNMSVLLEIDTQGALKVKATNPGALLIFIEPPSMSELESRLTLRGTDDPAVISKRINGAIAEMNARDAYDFRVTNTTVESAVAQIESILNIQEADHVPSK